MTPAALHLCREELMQLASRDGTITLAHAFASQPNRIFERTISTSAALDQAYIGDEVLHPSGSNIPERRKRSRAALFAPVSQALACRFMLECKRPVIEDGRQFSLRFGEFGHNAKATKKAIPTG